MSNALIAAPAMAADTEAPVVLAKAGVTVESRQKDFELCRQQAKNPAPIVVGPPQWIGTPSSAELAGGVAAALLINVIAASLDHKHAKPLYAKCVKDLGYRPARLTDDEAAEYSKLRGRKAQLAWEDSFFASSRLIEAVKPLTPPLPEAKAEEALVGGVRVTPGSLIAKDGYASAKDAVVFESRGVLVARGRLSNGFTYGPSDVSVRTGEAFYQTVVVDPGSLDVVTAWCGRGQSGGQDMSVCVISDYDGYAIAVTPSSGVTPSMQLPAALSKARMTTPLGLSDIAADTPVTVELRISSLNSNAIELKAIAISESDRIEMATLTVPFDIDGHAGTFFAGSSLVFDLDKQSSALSVRAKVMKIEVEPLKPFTPSRR